MHIKPYVVLGLATVCAGTSLGVLVTQSDPYTASGTILALFWAAAFLTVCGAAAALASLFGLRLGAAILAGLLWAVSVSGQALARRAGHGGWGLSAIVLGATILLSFLLWWRMHRKRS